MCVQKPITPFGVALCGGGAPYRMCAEPFAQTKANGPAWWARLVQKTAPPCIAAVTDVPDSAIADADMAADMLSGRGNTSKTFLSTGKTRTIIELV